jgi:hypothetical protein
MNPRNKNPTTSVLVHSTGYEMATGAANTYEIVANELLHRLPFVFLKINWRLHLGTQMPFAHQRVLHCHTPDPTLPHPSFRAHDPVGLLPLKEELGHQLLARQKNVLAVRCSS